MMPEKSCPICGSAASESFMTASCPRRGIERAFYLYRCGDCRGVYLHPRLSEEELTDIYHADYENEWGEGRNLKQKVETILVKGVPRKPPGRLLDVGCGTGQYIAVMERKGWTVAGVDPWAVHFDRRTLHPAVIGKTLHDATFDDGSFDVVTLWWAIEHFDNPRDIVRECRRILKPGGLLALSTCNIDSFEARLFGKYWHHLVLPEHCALYSHDVLAELVRSEGFTNTKVKQVIITNGLVGSLNGYLKSKGIRLPLDNIFAGSLGIPVELLLAALGTSGLFVMFAEA